MSSLTALKNKFQNFRDLKDTAHRGVSQNGVNERFSYFITLSSVGSYLTAYSLHRDHPPAWTLTITFVNIIQSWITRQTASCIQVVKSKSSNLSRKRHKDATR